MLTNEQKSLRKIGGSDAGSILGLNPYKSRFELWLEKTGQAKDDFNGNKYTDWGNRLEPVILQKFYEERGIPVMTSGEVLIHPEYEFMTATLDGMTEDGFVVEIKTTGNDLSEPLETWLAQVHHYMTVTGADGAFICCLSRGQEYKQWFIQADKDIQNLLIEEEIRFWEEVQAYLENKIEIIEKPRPIITLSKHVEVDEKLIADYVVISKEIKKLTSELEEIKNALKEQLGDCEYGDIDGRTVVTYKLSERESVDTKALEGKYQKIYDELKTKKQVRTLLIKEK